MTSSIPEPRPDSTERLSRFLSALNNVILGKETPVLLAATALIAKGHLLIEDVPGVGKTTLARALAKGAGLPFKRIQFTADLLPSDVTGVTVFNPDKGEFEFHPGPIFTPILLADEINRATPKTQSSLLEAMSEFQVTTDQGTRDLPDPFFVVATQNPQEHFGTFPLPESQMDRFLMRIRMGYPNSDEQKRIMKEQRLHARDHDMPPCLEPQDLMELQSMVPQIFVKDEILDYMERLVDATRHHESVQLGVSPRGGIALYRCCQAYALIQGRDFVIPDDVMALTPFVLGHRLTLSGRGPADPGLRQDQEQIVQEILSATTPPL